MDPKVVLRVDFVCNHVRKSAFTDDGKKLVIASRPLNVQIIVLAICLCDRSAKPRRFANAHGFRWACG